MIAFKFLSIGAIAPFSGVPWPASGRWLEAEGVLETCANGLHACPLDALAYWLDDELWTVQLDGEILDEGTVLVARRARLVERVEGWPDVSPALARACAERARGLSERVPRNARVVTLAGEAADCAKAGSGLEGTLVAAYAAAVAADLLDAGSFEAERAWQSGRLAELLGLHKS